MRAHFLSGLWGLWYNFSHNHLLNLLLKVTFIQRISFSAFTLKQFGPGARRLQRLRLRASINEDFLMAADLQMLKKEIDTLNNCREYQSLEVMAKSADKSIILNKVTRSWINRIPFGDPLLTESLTWRDDRWSKTSWESARLLFRGWLTCNGSIINAFSIFCSLPGALIKSTSSLCS